MLIAHSLDDSTHRLTVLKVNILHQQKDNMHAVYIHVLMGNDRITALRRLFQVGKQRG